MNAPLPRPAMDVFQAAHGAISVFEMLEADSERSLSTAWGRLDPAQRISVLMMAGASVLWNCSEWDALPDQERDLIKLGLGRMCLVLCALA